MPYPEREGPMDKAVQSCAMCLHFSQLAVIFIPVAGLIVPFWSRVLSGANLGSGILA